MIRKRGNTESETVVSSKKNKATRTRFNIQLRRNRSKDTLHTMVVRTIYIFIPSKLIVG